jgi:xanthine dehydrogenase accessory factor
MRADQPPEDLLQTIVDLCDQGRPCAVVAVLDSVGSTPRKAGAKAVVEADGTLHGTIGGGAVEAEAQHRAVEAMRLGRPTVFDFDLEGACVAAEHPLCGGRMRVLVDPTASQRRAAFAAAAAAGRRRERGVLLTSIRGADQVEVIVRFVPQQEISQVLEFPGAEALAAALQEERPRRSVSSSAAGSERVEVLAEPLIPPPQLLIVGGGHIGQAVAVQANLVGFAIVVLDDRPEFTAPELFPPGTVTRCGPIGEQLAGSPVGADTYIVIVTRGHQHDAEALAACLDQPAAYVGMIGSRRKVARMRQAFIESGRATGSAFDRVRAPIGLNIGAATVPEIATSIVAELIAVRRLGRTP